MNAAAPLPLIGKNGKPNSFFYPVRAYRIPWRERLKWALLALRGHVGWTIWNFPDPETGEPKSMTMAGWPVERMPS